MGIVHIEPIPGDPTPQLKITIANCPPAKDGVYYCDDWTLFASQITQPKAHITKRAAPQDAANPQADGEKATATTQPSPTTTRATTPTAEPQPPQPSPPSKVRSNGQT